MEIWTKVKKILKLSPPLFHYILKFIYSEKATNFFEIFTLLLSYVVAVKSKVKISQNFVAFSKYMNFKQIFDLDNLMGTDEIACT